jgi:hypothetical protein
MMSINTLNTELEAARTKLASALDAGLPTRTIRAEITSIESAIADVVDIEEKAQRIQSKQDASAVHAAGADLIGVEHAAIELATASPELGLLGEPLPVIECDPSIAAAAHSVASARAALIKEENFYSRLQAAASKCQVRLNEELAKVAVIKQRRAAGDRREDDAGAMTLLEDDIADLERLFSEAQQRVNSSAPLAQRQVLEAAEQRLAQARAQAQLRIANERLQLAERAFLSCYAIQRAAERATGMHLSRPSGAYRAGIEFKNIVSRH